MEKLKGIKYLYASLDNGPDVSAMVTTKYIVFFVEIYQYPL